MAWSFWRGFLAGSVVGAIVGTITRYRAEPEAPPPAGARVPVRPLGIIRRRHP
ncbi:hypothetical protein [Neomoorella thermoacetica]|uniref:hypothetical protein n=1 Tax=Neomoorella thermoacetica TaxID=1525 RepID=UPI000AB0EB2C|nr:hypothetical protein [Moorella thermoacetica]